MASNPAGTVYTYIASVDVGKLNRWAVRLTVVPEH